MQGIQERLRQWSEYESQHDKLVTWLAQTESHLKNYHHKSSLGLMSSHQGGHVVLWGSQSELAAQTKQDKKLLTQTVDMVHLLKVLISTEK